ncbi:ATP-dependent DNA helicase PIF1-like [Leptopilina heterotoma]|uniref:ATP-dependent DNA helicase PIF1-like n=1 Tax=Leptopilina heterotoma TaxID=63436 RepID=UPI001CA9A09B|nr:ATP-dependent DNA helicase PIF1-like [Leptopilina heterotoma]
MEEALIEAEAVIDSDEENNSEIEIDLNNKFEVDIFDQTNNNNNNNIKKCLHDENIKQINRIAVPVVNNKETIFQLMTELNKKQRLIAMHILNCFKMDKLPLRIFISGSAGVGKSKLIDTIYQLISNYLNENPNFNPETIKILLCAPSGKAAFLINEVTLHTAFALPITQYGGQISELSSNVANNLREKINDVKLVIIDEISMVGSCTLSRVDFRLRQIKGINESFGGISVILVGDLYQLPPVMDRAIYLPPKDLTLNVFAQNILWDEFYYFELTEIMRQKDDVKFIKALNNLANGQLSTDDVNLFSSRIVKENEVPEDAIRLYVENKMVDMYNDKKIKKSDKICYVSTAIDHILDRLRIEREEDRERDYLKRAENQPKRFDVQLNCKCTISD